MEAPLRLRPAEPAGPVAGYVIPSPDPAVWAEELLAGPNVVDDARVFVLPISATDLRPFGAFVTVPGGAKLGPRCQPYIRKGDRLYFPADGRLDPDFGAAEIEEKLSGDVLVLHPTLGLVGFAARDGLPIADLFTRPEVAASAWNRAQPGVRVARLLSLEPYPPPQLETIFVAEGRDIGSDSPSKLASGGGVGDALGKGLGAGLSAAGAGVRGVERLMDALRDLAGQRGKEGAGEQGGVLKNLREWLEKKGLDFAALQERRNKAVEELVELLKKNPDRGLKYALPLAGDGGRGVAAPGDRLGTRDVNFSLAGVFGGSGPVDAWSLRYDLQRKLDEEYRRIARREAELGRFRRAAYIYAQLLGDDAAAAAVLKQGRHFHEAAVLYERRINDLREAARCYEQAGAIDQAVQLYERLRDHEAAGDLLTCVGRTEDARSSYHVAAVVASDDGNDLKAAEIYEHKLREIPYAYLVLEKAWPGKPQAVACARRLFELTGRTGDFDRARRLLARIDEPTPAVNAAARAQLFVEAFETHPSEAVRADASRRAWELLGREMPRAGTAEQPLLQLLPRLAPNDRLLKRDAAHYPQMKRAPRGRPGELLRAWRLPLHLANPWGCVVATDATYYAVGADERNVGGLLRGDWTGAWQVVPFGRPDPTTRTATLAVTAAPELLVLVKSAGRQAPELPPTAAFPTSVPVRPLDADKPFLSLGVCNDELGRVWMLNGRHLHRYDARFHFARSYLIDRPEPWAEAPRMAAVGDHLFLSDGSSLYLHRHGVGASATFPPVLSMATTAGYTAPLAAFGMSMGVAFGRADQPLKDFHVAGTRETLREPLVGFSRDGRLVASDGARALVFREDRGVRPVLEFEVGLGPLKWVTRTGAANEIAFFAESGDVRIYALGP